MEGLNMDRAYAKIIDNGDSIEMAPEYFVENGTVIYGFTPEFLMERGYYPVDYTYPGDEVNVYKAHYKLVNNVIEQTWILVTSL